jgi:Ohr subfamily peroxiredoxin
LCLSTDDPEVPPTVSSLYTAYALATGDGRNGHVTSDDKRIDLDLAMPPSLGGSGEGANPEQLFAAGYSACFHSALRLVAKGLGADVSGSEVGAQVSLVTNEAGAFNIAVVLEISLPATPPELAEQVAQAAHQVCPYSNATRGNIPVELVVMGASG